MHATTYSFCPKLMFKFPDIIGFYSVVEAIRRASDAFLSSPSALFSRALLANPRAMGAACPSSLKLARTIADLVIPPDNDNLILELGGGTGIVTKALLQLYSADKLLAAANFDFSATPRKSIGAKTRRHKSKKSVVPAMAISFPLCLRVSSSGNR